MQQLIKKIENSVVLIRNSRELAGKFKKDKINQKNHSAQTAIYMQHGQKVMKNYE